MGKAIKRLMSELETCAVLFDIGASGGPPLIWDEIAQHSIYVGFDPDLRELREVSGGHFYKAIIVNEAVTICQRCEEMPFYFTKSPYCSSTLKPDAEALSNYLFSDLFVVEKEARVRATSLDSIIDRLALRGIDWLKVDSQGTDLRIFNSLREEVRFRVLALDIEPGLIDAYVGEDLFVSAHRDLTRNGFWLSNLNVGGAIRMRRATLDTISTHHQRSSEDLVAKAVRASPGWCEARYLRTLEWLAQGNFTQREYVLLWIFALLDRQFGFALDLGIEYEQRFGTGEVARFLRSKPFELIKRTRLIAPVKSLLLRGVCQIIQLAEKYVLRME